MATKARQQYFADEDSLQKIRREFSIADDIQQKIDSIEPGAQVNKIETVKVNGTALVPDANKAVNVEVPEVIDNLYTVDSDNALSAKQGKLLYDYIQNIASRGRFLSNWNSATGLPMTNPSESPYPYKSGDYFIVSNVAGLGGTNYRPDGSSYIIGQASTVVETDSVDVSDFYFYDGTNWLLLKNSGRSGAVDSALSTTSTNPVENRVITNALNGKQETLIAGNNIQIAADGKTISATDTTYSAGANISIDANNEISAVDTTYTAGTNVQISNQNVISATDTTYTAGTGINIDANNVISSTATSAQWGNITGTLSNQTDLQNALDSKVNLGMNQVFDSTVVEIGKWEQGQGGASSGHHITLDPSGEVSTYNITTGGHNEATLGSGILTVIKNTAIGGNEEAVYSHENIVADNGTDTETYNFFGNNRIARLSDVGGTYSAGNGINIDANNIISNTLPGATVSATAPSSPSEGDLWYDTANDALKAYDGTNWNIEGTRMTILKYGISTWNDFITAYNDNAIVYCRASNQSNPATGSQTRMAFMAYVNNETTPTEVEFQYYRSRSDHNSAANQLDQVFVYKLTSASGGTWTVTERNTAAKAVAGTGISLGWGSGNMTISADTSVLATQTDLNSKQDTLVSGTNIKTVNNQSLLGSGNITISAPTYTAGENITIDQNNEISATDTKYNAGYGLGLVNGYQAMRGPCPEGYHVPSETEASQLISTMAAFGFTGLNDYGTYLKMPIAGYISGYDASSHGVNEGDYMMAYWTCTTSSIHSGGILAMTIHGSGPDSLGNSVLVWPHIKTFGFSIRPFKDEPVAPDSNWTVLYTDPNMSQGSGIYYNPKERIISISSTGSNWITISDRNLGATKVFQGNYTGEDVCGRHFQWGNNYGFSYSGPTNTSTTKVDTQGYGPSTYSSDIFIYDANDGDWSNPANRDLWGGETGIIPNTFVNRRDISTKTFVLEGLTDLATAQAAYDWYISGKNPILVYSNCAYILVSADSSNVIFRSSKHAQTDNASYSAGKEWEIKFYLSSGTVTSYSNTNKEITPNVLATDVDYSTPYTPQYDGSPATKKYVDDSIASAGGLQVAPNSPITGIKYVWYGTEADYANLNQYYTDTPGDTEFRCF